LARDDNLLAREANDSTALSPHNRPVMKQTLPLAPLLAVILLPFSGNGEVTVTVQEVGSDVVISYNGSWDNWVSVGFFPGPIARVFPEGLVLLSSDLSDVTSLVGGLTRQSGTWTPKTTSSTSFAGDAFGWSGTNLFAARNYTQGDQFTGSLTFSGTDLATMGFTPGDTGVFSGGGNTVNFSVTGPGVSAIPEPSSLLGLAGLMTASTFLRRRRPCS
jgi:hypothetical protein